MATATTCGGEFPVGVGAVDKQVHQRENARYLAQYQAGALDVHEFLSFQLEPLTDNPVDSLLAWRERFVRDWIAPLVLPKGRALIEDHRRRDHCLAIVTSTNAFITRPIADLMGIAHLLATQPEFDGQHYTGKYLGEPCSGTGKVHWVREWAARIGMSLADSWFYSDSYQDLPLPSLVDHPVAVDPDDALREHARLQKWPILSLR